MYIDTYNHIHRKSIGETRLVDLSSVGCRAEKGAESLRDLDRSGGGTAGDGARAAAGNDGVKHGWEKSAINGDILGKSFRISNWGIKMSAFSEIFLRVFLPNWLLNWRGRPVQLSMITFFGDRHPNKLAKAYPCQVDMN